MPFVACPSCGERGKIPPTLVGSRIKCKKCGISFNVAPSSTKASASSGAVAETATASAAGTPHEGIPIEGLDENVWEAPSGQSDALRSDPEAYHSAAESADSHTRPVSHEATGLKEYKLLTSKDKIFEGKFDLARLEEALNYYARQGWVVKAVSTPNVKTFSGGMQEEIVVLLER
jgi:hypothetical protein